MGLFRRGLIKAGMIVGSIFAAGAAVGAAAKSAYRKKRNSYNNAAYDNDKTYTYTKSNNTTKTYNSANTSTVNNSANKNPSTVELMNKEHAVFKSSSNNNQKYYGSASAMPNNARATRMGENVGPSTHTQTASNQTQTKTVYKLRQEDPDKQKEVQKRIKELSQAPITASGLGAVVGSYLIPFLFIVGALLLCHILDFLTLGQFISLSIFSLAFLIYLCLLVGAFRYKKNTKKTREAMENIRYNLNYYKKLKDKSIDSINNDYTTEVVVYQTALRNMANTYNDYISQVSNLLYTKIFSISEFDCEENVQQENIILKRTK